MYIMYIWHVYLYMYIRCIYIYMICISMYLTCPSMYSTCLSIYNTPKKDTNTSRNVGTWTLWGRHHQSTIVEALFGIFFWFTTLYSGWLASTNCGNLQEPLQLRFFWFVVLNEPIPNSDSSLHLRLCAWAWRVNGQHVWAVTGSPVFF